MKVRSGGKLSATKTIKTRIQSTGPSGKTETTTETTKVDIVGRFSSAKKVSGAVTIVSQSFQFSFQPKPQKCQGQPEAFTAKAK